MALPNMAMIPSGYKPTKLYSVLPTETYGSELVTNGDFATDSNWSKQAGWTISGGKANANMVLGGNGNIYQTMLTIGKTYKLTFTVSNYVQGYIRNVSQSGTTTTLYSSNGTFTETFVATSANLFMNATTTQLTQLSIDNVSVKEVLVGNADFDVTRATPATRVNQQGLIETPEFILSGDIITNGDFSNGSTDWSLGSGWTIGSKKVDAVDSAFGSSFTQNMTIVSGKQYKVSFDVSNYIKGNVRMGVGNTWPTPVESNGSFTFFLTAASNTPFKAETRAGGSGTTLSVSNISVIQVERHNIPRLDYTDGTCPVLLTEPLSTNLITESQDFSDSSWANLGGKVLITINNIISPDGTQNATKFEQIANTADATIRFVGLTVGVEYTFSLYAKKGNFDNLQLDIGDVAVAFTITDDWVRYEITKTAVGNFVDITLRFGSIGDYFYIWGAQVEELPYSTSIIPTNGSTVTRNQDIVNNAGTSATYNSTEGVLFWNGSNSVNGGNPETMITLSDGTSNNVVQLIMHSTPNRIVFRITLAGVGIVNIDSTDVSQTEDLKIGLKYKENDFALWINGVEKATSLGSSFSSNTISTLQFADGNGIKNFFGKTSQVQVFNTALSDFDLQNLTSNATAYASYETMRTSLNFNIQ